MMNTQYHNLSMHIKYIIYYQGEQFVLNTTVKLKIEGGDWTWLSELQELISTLLPVYFPYIIQIKNIELCVQYAVNHL